MRRLPAILGIVFLATGAVGPAWAVPPPPSPASGASSEAGIKAGIVFNLARAAEWPEPVAMTSPFVICLVGLADSDPALAELDGKNVRRRACVVRVDPPPATASEAQIVYISQSRQTDLAALLRQFAGHPVLTVSEIAGFCEAGGMVQLRRDRNRILLRVNREAAERAGLRLSSELLKIAELVKGGD